MKSLISTSTPSRWNDLLDDLDGTLHENNQFDDQVISNMTADFPKNGNCVLSFRMFEVS